MLEMSAQINELQAAAYHRERVAGRRLARLTGVSEAQALRHILLQAAAPGSLEDLLQTRHAAREAALAQRAARRQHKLEMRAQKDPAAQSEVEAWQGWFDGSSHPNPGRIGIGGVLHGPAAQRIEICAYAGHGDSNQAEYLALIAVLEAALEVRPQALIVYGDSQVVIGDVGKACGAGALVLLPYRERVQHLLAQLGGVSLKWIARHKNAAADALSQRAVKQQTMTLQQPADI